MTAPDPGLTDLIAAHTTNWERRCLGGDESYLQCDCGDEFEDELSWAAHLKLVVEQHTNGQTAKLAEAVQGMWRLIRKLDETSDGLGDWHDATEYIDWARKEVQEIYVRAALEGEQQ